MEKLLGKMNAEADLGSTAKTALLLLEAVQLMTKWEAAAFINNINSKG